MRLLDLTLPIPEANLALDEALLNLSETSELGSAGNFANVLRIWEAPSPFVVIGRGSKIAVEANLPACEADGVPVLRRCSGGTAVVAGPGCLMYGVILSYEQHPELKSSVDKTHQFVMQRMRDALARLSPDVTFRGSCDLAIGEAKFSGNALRCKRRHLLYHGTVLYDFDLDSISKWLGQPPRMPDYRAGRTHSSFVTNFPFSALEIRQVIGEEFGVNAELTEWPEEETMKLVGTQYSENAWNARL